MAGASVFEANGFTYQELWALAQLVKRITWTEISQNAASTDEAYTMRDSIEKLGHLLAKEGFAPR